MPKRMTIEDFTPYQNENFFLKIESAGLTIEMKLIEVSEISNSQPEREWKPFSLVFLGPSQYPLNQQIHRLTHPEMGELDLFLVPIYSNQEGLKYESVFN